MQGFKQHLVEFDNPQIYCDMDGVVADFLKLQVIILEQDLKMIFGMNYQ